MSKIPYVENGQLFEADGTLICPVETSKETKPTAWMKWLKNPRNDSFSYSSPVGSLTAIKEPKKFNNGSSGTYWYGHRTINKKKRSKSIGSINYTSRFDMARLDFVAAYLAKISLAEAAPTEEVRAGWKEAGKRQPQHEPYYPPGRLPVNQGEPVTGSQVSMFADTDQDREDDRGGAYSEF